MYKETIELKNNEEFKVVKIDNKTITIKNDRLEADINHKQFTHFDLAYCITTHVSQGSTYDFASLGLTTGQKLYSHLKSNGETGYTISKINEFLKSLEVNQVLTKRRGDISFVAEGPLQILLLEMQNIFSIFLYVIQRGK